MKRQHNNQQEGKIRIIPYDKVEELRCSRKIAYLKEKLNEKATVIQHGEFYIEMPKRLVNSALFFLFGELSYFENLEKKEKKEFDNTTTQKEYKFIQKLFQKISRPTFETAHRQSAFIDHIHTHATTLMCDQMIVEIAAKLWDKYGPKILPTHFPTVYFKLDLYNCSTKPGVRNKRTLISKFDQTDESIILCFFEAKNQFSKNSIDQIIVQALKRQKLLQELPKKQKKIVPKSPQKQIPKPQENQLPKPQKTEFLRQFEKDLSKQKKGDKNKSKPVPQNPKLQENPKSQQIIKSQKPEAPKVGQQNPNKGVTCFEIFYYIFFVLVMFIAWHEWGYQKGFKNSQLNQATYQMNELQAKLLENARLVKEAIIPVKESLTEWSSENIKPLIDPVAEKLIVIVNHEIVVNLTETAKNDLHLGFKAVKEVFDKVLSDVKTQGSQRQEQL